MVSLPLRMTARITLSSDGYDKLYMGTAAAAAEDEAWLAQHQNRKVVFLEIGVGYNTPGIIKYSFWQQVYRNRHSVYACLNMEKEQVPEEIRERSVIISGDSAQVLRELIS